MFSHNPKTKKKVTVEDVKCLWSSDEVRRVIMHGEKDYIAVKVSGVKMYEQELLLFNSKVTLLF
jgi:hypothetical protein